MRASGRVTLNDVAAASGVSRSTAGFVLADDPNQTISAATRERVKAAARELGYVTHGVARALREGSSRVVVLDIDQDLEGNYSRSYIRGLDAELAAHDHALLVRHGPQTLRSDQQVLHAIAPRAVLRFGEAYRTGHDLEDRGGGWRDGLAAHAALQLGHLVARGHRHIVLALPTAASPLTEARQRFAASSARVLGIEPPAAFTVPRVRAEAAAALAALRSAQPQVTAVAAFTDDIALRVLAGLRDLGLRAPEDLAVMGYDDTEYGALVTPALTTVHIDAEAHGRLTARTVLGLDTAGLGPTPASVIVRESA